MIKHFGNPPETEIPPPLEPKRSNLAIADQLIIRMRKLETHFFLLALPRLDGKEIKELYRK